MKFVRTLTAASVLAFSAAASAEQGLSPVEMDGVSAGGSALADAVANAFGGVTSAVTGTTTVVKSVLLVPGQFGGIYDIKSLAIAGSTSDSDGQAVAAAKSAGYTQGSLLSDTLSGTFSETNTSAPLPYAVSYGHNASVAATILVGYDASAQSATTSAAALHN